MRRGNRRSSGIFFEGNALLELRRSSTDSVATGSMLGAAAGAAAAAANALAAELKASDSFETLEDESGEDGRKFDSIAVSILEGTGVQWFQDTCESTFTSLCTSSHIKPHCSVAQNYFIKGRGSKRDLQGEELLDLLVMNNEFN